MYSETVQKRKPYEAMTDEGVDLHMSLPQVPSTEIICIL